jgi:hypothetical protein
MVGGRGTLTRVMYSNARVVHYLVTSVARQSRASRFLHSFFLGTTRMSIAKKAVLVSTGSRKLAAFVALVPF